MWSSPTSAPQRCWTFPVLNRSYGPRLNSASIQCLTNTLSNSRTAQEAQCLRHDWSTSAPARMQGMRWRLSMWQTSHACQAGGTLIKQGACYEGIRITTEGLSSSLSAVSACRNQAVIELYY